MSFIKINKKRKLSSDTFLILHSNIFNTTSYVDNFNFNYSNYIYETDIDMRHSIAISLSFKLAK